MSKSIKDVTKWIGEDTDEEFKVGDYVEVTMTSDEKAIGEISYLSGDYMSVDSEKFGEVSFSLEDVEEIVHVEKDN